MPVYTSQPRIISFQLISSREKEILELISFGMTTDEIAENLFVSQDTVKSHRKSLLNKMKVRNVAHLVRVAFEQGILQES
ncbi:MAG: helix-turn-helix transcriptional regulator [Saprospiraceae bacterium]|nr:helix-turn-helix transcriptional regulator [Saprospiraceae bacterium]